MEINCKEILRNFLITKLVNKVIIQKFRKIPFFARNKYFSRIPVVGVFTLKNIKGNEYKIYANGYDPIASEAFWKQGYEENLMKHLSEFGKNAEYFFDIGANTGFLTINMGLMPKVKKVFSFEPLPIAFEILQTNIKLNNLKNCEAFKIGIGDKCSKLSFYVPNVKSIPSSSSLDKNFYRSTEEIKIDVITLDSFIEVNKIKKVDLVKIDVEGMELSVLHGMQNILINFRPIIFCEILTTEKQKQIYDYIWKNSYKMFQIFGNKLLDYDTNLCNDLIKDFNFILCPKENELENLTQN